MMPKPSDVGQPRVAGDFAVTLTPGFEKTPENFAKFRWNANVALPYPFPSRKCHEQTVVLNGKPFTVSIHNHYDRITQTIRANSTSPPIMWAFLINRPEASPSPRAGCISMNRERLPSVVRFDGQTDFATYPEAVAGATETISAALEWLSLYLAAWQREAPYLSTWEIYPVSDFDIGTVFHQVRGYCTKHNKWELFSCGLHFRPAKTRLQPTFVMDPPATIEAVSPADTANELLAEALMSLYRGLPRMTVVNAYGAIESFANVVYTKMQATKLAAEGVPTVHAEKFANMERSQHRTEVSFLFHRGMKEAAGRSLHDENKQLYDALNKLQQVRHSVSHTGYKPTTKEAREGHKLCCEVMQWLTGVGGFPVKQLVPDSASSIPGLVACVR